jgi:hypothetical protein
MASLSMEGDDTQLVDSILREMNASSSPQASQMAMQMPPQQPVYDQNTLNMIQMNQQNSNAMTHHMDPQLYGAMPMNPMMGGQETPRKKVEVAYTDSAVNWNVLWRRIKYPLIVFIICMIVFNPDLYNILARTIPSVFTAPTRARLYLRTSILSLMVALLYGITIIFV